MKAYLFLIWWTDKEAQLFFYFLKCSTVAQFNNQTIEKMQSNFHFAPDSKTFANDKKTFAFASFSPYNFSNQNSSNYPQAKDRAMFTSSI